MAAWAILCAAQPAPSTDTVRFGGTRFIGLERLHVPSLEKLLPYGPGDRFERRRLVELQTRLYDLGLFEEVAVRATTTSAGTAEIAAHVTEKPFKWVKTGVGYGSEERERLSLTLTHLAPFGRPRRVESVTVYSAVWLEQRLETYGKRLFGRTIDHRAAASWRREDQRGYDIERVGGSASVGRSLPLRAHGALRYRLDRTVLYNLSPDVLSEVPAEGTLSAVAAVLDRDTTDDLFYPLGGTRLTGTIERTGGVLGGNIHFNRFKAQGSAYRRLHRRSVLAATVRGGAMRGFGPTRVVPVYERLFIGGASTLRGFRERDVGPKSDTGDPLGGTRMLGAGIEARSPLYKRLGVGLFVDGGMVSDRGDLVFPALWKWGGGAGLRVATPVGPLRLDAAYKLDPDPGDRALWRAHFTLGEAF